jgi:hypothetical protein
MPETQSEMPIGFRGKKLGTAVVKRERFTFWEKLRNRSGRSN